MAYLDGLLVALFHVFKVFELETLGPSPLMQVQQHALFGLCLPVIDRQAWACVSALPYLARWWDSL